ERRGQDNDDAPPDRAPPPGRRLDRAARPAVPARRPAAPVRGRRAGRVAVVLPVPVRTPEPARTRGGGSVGFGGADRRAARARRPARAGEGQGGGLEALLTDQGVVRLRVGREQAEAARAALDGIAPEIAVAGGGVEVWLTVHVEPSRAAEVNRRLAEAGIYASGLEAGTDLEPLF